MKTLSILIILFFFVSCSSGRLDRKIEDSSWDALADESFLRWGQKRLEKSTNNQHQVIGCYLGESAETLETYKKNYLAKNQDTHYWLHIGNCYFIQEKWSKAEFYYRLTLEETKSKTMKSIALNNLGLIYFKYDQWEKGKEFLKESINNAPEFRVPRYNMSQLYLQFGFHDKAIEALNDSVFKGHKDIDVYFSLANAYLFKGDLKTSAQYFDLIPKNQFRREDIAATYALYLIKLGKIRDAKSVMDKRERSHVLEITSISQKIEKMIGLRLKEE